MKKRQRNSKKAKLTKNGHIEKADQKAALFDFLDKVENFVEPIPEEEEEYCDKENQNPSNILNLIRDHQQVNAEHLENQLKCLQE